MLLVGLLTWVLAAALAAPAHGQQREHRQSFEFTLTADRLGASTGFSERIDYVNPSDPTAKPPAVETVVARLPVGTTIDTSVPGRCSAPDPALISQGPDACSANSVVGDGLVDLDTGIAGPGRIISSDVTLLNAENELILLFEERGTGRRLVSRARIAGRSFTTTVPPLPGGPPDGFTAIDRVQLDVEAVTRGAAAYIKTPESCPRAGHWVSTGTFTYRDGTEQIVGAGTRCRAEPDPDSRRCSASKRGTGDAEVLRGTVENDRLRGMGGADRLFGFAGSDCLLGGAGPDRLHGGKGADRLQGQRGADRLQGDSGRDVIRGNGGRDVLNGGAGSDEFYGGLDRDLIRAADGARDVVRCGRGRDRAIVDRRDRVRGCERVRRR